MSDWIEHDGTCCPVPAGTWVELRFADNGHDAWVIDEADTCRCWNGVWSCWFWDSFDGCENTCDRIIAYRIPSSKHVDEIKRSIKSPVDEMA